MSNNDFTQIKMMLVVIAFLLGMVIGKLYLGG